MYCSQCGAKMEALSMFCAECGAKNDQQEIIKTSSPDMQSDMTAQKSPGAKQGKIIVIFLTVISLIILGFMFVQQKGNYAITNVHAETYPIVSFELKAPKDVKTEDLKIMVNGIEQNVKSIEPAAGKGIYTVTYEVGEDLQSWEKVPVDFKVKIGNWSNASGNYTPPFLNNLKFSVSQVETAKFPLVKVIFSVLDESDNDAGDIPAKLFTVEEKVGKDGIFKPVTVSSISKMMGKEAISVCLAVDVSDSMSGEPIESTKSSIADFMDRIQFGTGDQVSMIAYNDTVSLACPYTSRKADILDTLWKLNTGSRTALYDALQASLIESNRQTGAKCVIAFTDGDDNSSQLTPEDIISLSQKLSIPIYIINVGNAGNEGVLRQVAGETKGGYWYINEINGLSEAYAEIYQKKMNQYSLEYTTQAPDNRDIERNLNIMVQGKKIGGMLSYEFTPKKLFDPSLEFASAQQSTVGMSDIEKAIFNYEHGIVKGINNNDFSELAPALDSSGEIYEQQRNLIKHLNEKNIREKLLLYMIEGLTKVSENEYTVTTFEKMHIAYSDKPAQIRDFRNVYRVVLTSEGWRVSTLLSLDTLSVSQAY